MFDLNPPLHVYMLDNAAAFSVNESKSLQQAAGRSTEMFDAKNLQQEDDIKKRS